MHIASQENFRLLWNPKVYYGVQKNSPTAPILSQMNPTHILQTHFSKKHFNIILTPLPHMLHPSMTEVVKRIEIKNASVFVIILLESFTQNRSHSGQKLCHRVRGSSLPCSLFKTVV
jgi:hypothetical protein